MKIHDPWLLCFALLWILFCYIPAPMAHKGSGKPMSKLERVIFSGIGWAILLQWYSLC